MDEETKQVSRYNEAAMQIMRLHELWLKAELYANRGLLIKWKFILDSVWRELYSDVQRQSDSKKIIKDNKKLKQAISKCKIMSSLYTALNERHEFLKEIQNSVGKGAMYRDIDDDDFD